jgi:hypothetical protein
MDSTGCSELQSRSFHSFRACLGVADDYRRLFFSLRLFDPRQTCMVMMPVHVEPALFCVLL